MTTGFRGAEFFTTKDFETVGLRDPFMDSWRRWERDGYPAGSKVPAAQVPAALSTRAVCQVPFMVDVTEWAISVASVEVNTQEWIEWERVLPEIRP